ncbi:MAG: UV DNA damage repair endonuclease UvsE [Elusimicrobiota bacterium]
MRIGYPCMNYSIGCTSSSTFRLKNYSEDNLVSKITSNLACLKDIFKYNKINKIFFFRITSDLVPFASHPVCKFNWRNYFRKDFQELGNLIKKNQTRVSMHPDQFVIINAKKKRIVENSIRELAYHSDVLDLMGLPQSAKIQIHAGGVYGNKSKSTKRFIKEYRSLSDKIKKRLVLENDDRSYTARDCLQINSQTQIPLVYDILHQNLTGPSRNHPVILKKTCATWREKDGLPIIDYSSQLSGGRPGQHAGSIDIGDFKKFLSATAKFDFDIMLEIKDKEKSAEKAISAARCDKRLFTGLKEKQNQKCDFTDKA